MTMASTATDHVSTPSTGIMGTRETKMLGLLQNGLPSVRVAAIMKAPAQSVRDKARRWRQEGKLSSPPSPGDAMTGLGKIIEDIEIEAAARAKAARQDCDDRAAAIRRKASAEIAVLERAHKELIKQNEIWRVKTIADAQRVPVCLDDILDMKPERS